MRVPARKGITLASYTGHATDLLAMAKKAEAQGYDDLWFADVGSPDALTLAAAIALTVKRPRIGIAVSPIYTRTPAVLAASAQTLHELSAGRFILGLGTSSHTIVQDWHGVPFEKPLQRTAEVVALLRQIFKGDKTNFQGDIIKSRGYKQAAADIPIYLAALRPKMLEVAAEIGDGVVLNLFPQMALAKIMEHIKTGAQKAKKTTLPEIVCRHQVVVCDEPEAVFDGLRAFLSSYFSTQVYNRYLAWCGYPKVAEELLISWQNKDRERSYAALSDELIHEIVIAGDEAHCEKRLRAAWQAGIDTHIISCLSADQKTQERTYQFCSSINFS